MTETKRDYEVEDGKPPVGRPFKKGQSGNPSGRPAKSAKSAPPLLVRKFDEQVLEATNGRCQKTTRREVVIVQLVDQPAAVGLSATKILTDVLKRSKRRPGRRRPLRQSCEKRLSVLTTGTDEPRIRAAIASDVPVIGQIVEQAYRHYIPRIGQPPGM